MVTGPRRFVSIWAAPIWASVFLFASPSARATIRYVVSLGKTQAHVFHVTMVVPQVGRQLTVAMPAWNALYEIRDFAVRVTKVEATEERSGSLGVPLRVVKLDKQTWRIEAGRGGIAGPLGTVEIQYDDYWNDPGPFNSQLNSHHAFLNLAEVLFYIPAERKQASEVQYLDLPPRWRIAEELPHGQSGHSFLAPSYDALVDAPAEIGTFQGFRENAGKARLRVVVDGQNWNQAQLGDTLRKIVAYETGMMRDVPFHEYMFLFHFGPFAEVGGGGMEHANSTAIAVPDAASVGNVAAHEFFHLWNVKRIRPQSLHPFDYTKEMWTRALWFAEGVTSTYAAYTMVRTKLWSHAQFYRDLARQFTMLEARPARHWQSVEESSLDTWLDKYPYYHRPDVSISYYNKGQILGVMLDLAIRNDTDNHRSLDDVLRAMNEDYAKRGRYYDGSKAIEQEVEKVSGHSFRAFFERYVSGTDEIPYAKFLGVAGLALRTEEQAVADFGFRTARASNGALRVDEVDPHGDAARAGVESGDVLLELDGKPFPPFATGWLYGHAPGETITVRVERNGTERDLSFALGEKQIKLYSISEEATATAREVRIREGLLHGTTE